jgi:MYXO-CTERM domain-containing protein
MNKLTRALMGTTCLTIAAAVPAVAGTVTETADFSNTLAGALPLPGGTDTVIGRLDCCGASDYSDFFTFQGLASGDYTFTFATGVHGWDSSWASLYLLGSSSPSFVGIFNTSQNFHLGESGSVTVGVNFEGEGAAYTATLTSQNVVAETPEPSTLLLGAAGLAGALAWRRKRTV